MTTIDGFATDKPTRVCDMTQTFRAMQAFMLRADRPPVVCAETSLCGRRVPAGEQLQRGDAVYLGDDGKAYSLDGARLFDKLQAARRRVVELEERLAIAIRANDGMVEAIGRLAVKVDTLAAEAGSLKTQLDDAHGRLERGVSGVTGKATEPAVERPQVNPVLIGGDGKPLSVLCCCPGVIPMLGVSRNAAVACLGVISRYFVRCPRCGARDQHVHETEGDAIREWNKALHKQEI